MSKTTDTSKPSRRRLLALLSAVALLLLCGLLFFGPSAPRELVEESRRPGEREARAGASSSQPASPFWDLAAQASAKADAADDAAPLDLQRWEAEWCEQAGNLPAGLSGQSLFERLEAGPPVERALRARRMQGLRALGNERALSVADLLDASLIGSLAVRYGMTPSAAEERVASEARARLRQRALSSGDGFVIAMALQRGCEDDACRLQLSQRWQQIEPHNLQAQLAVFSRGSAADSDGVLTAMAQSSVSENYRNDYMALMMRAGELPSAGPLQLMREVDAIGLGSAFRWPEYLKLVQLCESTASQPTRLQRCNEVAEKLFSLANDSIIEPMMAMNLASKLSQPAPLAAHWLQRQREVEAARELQRELVVGDQSNDWMSKPLRCQAGEQAEVMRMALGREWPILLAAAQARGIEALSQRYREPIQRPAPAASR